jgi:protein-L-isoaspartate(D-aspartate) O-methyltransferase
MGRFEPHPCGMFRPTSKVRSMSGFETARQHMVDGQVRPSDVTDIRILDAMLAVPREAFLPENQRAIAYLDLDIDFSTANAKRRFLIRPAVTAKLLQAARIRETDKVLIAGSAPGYTAAVAARLSGQVFATESDPAQVARAKEVLAYLGLGNVTFQPGTPAEGNPANAPYDVIVLDGATEVTPDRLYRQLGEGGRLVGVFALTKPSRAMIVTHSHGEFGNRVLFDAPASVLPGMECHPTFVF